MYQDAKRQEANIKRMAKHKKNLEKEEAKHAGANKERRKKRYIAEQQGKPLKYQRYTDGTCPLVVRCP